MIPCFVDLGYRYQLFIKISHGVVRKIILQIQIWLIVFQVQKLQTVNLLKFSRIILR